MFAVLLGYAPTAGDVSDLALSFAVNTVVIGNVFEVELKPGGAAIPVTNDNVVEYIHRVADFRLNVELARPTAAFLRGFFDLIRPEWVHMFNSHELQMLISGSEDGIDIEDLATHCAFAGGYHQDHPVILALWDALRSFSNEEQRAFIKFVTSCSRAPLLGFKYLEPPLCIQMSGSTLDEHGVDRLPTASTCMNLLKLPPYRSARALREKLLYAINSGSGFDLS
jgi:ubiquitin-protein ligase E3 C